MQCCASPEAMLQIAMVVLVAAATVDVLLFLKDCSYHMFVNINIV